MDKTTIFNINLIKLECETLVRPRSTIQCHKCVQLCNKTFLSFSLLRVHAETFWIGTPFACIQTPAHAQMRAFIHVIRTYYSNRPEHVETLEVHVRNFHVMKVNEAMTELSDVIHLRVFRQWRCRIRIKELTKSATGRKRHDNFQKAYVGSDDSVGREDVRVRKTSDQMDFCLEVFHDSVHLFQRALDCNVF